LVVIFRLDSRVLSRREDRLACWPVLLLYQAWHFSALFFVIQWVKCGATPHKIQDNGRNLEFICYKINNITFYVLRNYCIFQTQPRQ